MSGHGLSSDRLHVVLRTMSGVSVALAAVLVVCQSSSPRLRADDPPADDPFAPAKPPAKKASQPDTSDPFAEPAPKQKPVNPFGPEDPAEAAKRAAEEKRYKARQLRSLGIKLAKDLAADPDDALCVEGTLALLHLSGQDARGEPNRLELLERIARRRWQPAPGEPVGRMLARLQGRFAADARPAAQKYWRLAAEYRTVTSQAWPLDWRPNRDLLLGLVETIVDSRHAADPAGPWRAKIVADPDHADWHRLGYLAVVRAGAESKLERERRLDYALVRPWLEVRGPLTALHLRRMADVYRTSLVASVPEEQPARAATLRLLLRGLSKTRVTHFDMCCTLSPGLAAIYKSGGRVGRLVARTLVDHQNPDVFEAFAMTSAIPRQEQHRWFLGRAVSVAFHDEPLGEALRSLQAKVRVPLWIDESVRKDPTRVTLEFSGPWIDVLELALRGTKCRLELLRPDLLWVGTPEARREATEFLEKALARVPDTKTPLGAALGSRSKLEFIETPLQDVIDYMKDLHGVEITVVVTEQEDRKFRQVPLTVCYEGIPTCLALSLIAREAGGDWDVLDNVAVVGPTKRIEQLRKQRLERLRRGVRLTRTEAVGNAIAEPTTLEFIETPIAHVKDYLRDLHGANFALARSLDSGTPVTFNLRGVILGTALDLMLFRMGLCWDSDGEVIYVGDPKAVDAFTAMAAGRPARRGRYPKEAAEKLQRRIDLVDLDQVPLAELAALLDKNAVMGVRLGDVPAGATSEKVDVHFQHIPLDALLDLVCLELGLQWSATDRQTVVIEGKQEAAPR